MTNKELQEKLREFADDLIVTLECEYSDYDPDGTFPFAMIRMHHSERVTDYTDILENFSVTYIDIFENINGEPDYD